MLTQTWSMTDINFCHFRPFFTLLPHYWPRKLKFRNNLQNAWTYYPFTYVYQKSRSYHVWFLRYKVQRTELFVILGHHLPFDPPNNPKNQNFEKIKKNAWRYYHFPLVYNKWRYVSFLRYRARQTENPGKSNFEKNENNSWRYCHFTHEYHKWSTINEDHIMYDSEILSASGKIFTRFGPFFTHLPSPSSAPLTS